MSDWTSELNDRLAEMVIEPSRKAEIIEELAQHLEDRFIDLRSRGLSYDEARRIALSELNNHKLLATEIKRIERTYRSPLEHGTRRFKLVDDLMQGPSIRIQGSCPESWICFSVGSDARAWDRGQHRHLQCSLWGFNQAASVFRSRKTGTDLAERPPVADSSRLASRNLNSCDFESVLHPSSTLVDIRFAKRFSLLAKRLSAPGLASPPPEHLMPWVQLRCWDEHLRRKMSGPALHVLRF